MEAFREIFWDIAFGPLILYPLGVAALAILFMPYTVVTVYG